MPTSPPFTSQLRKMGEDHFEAPRGAFRARKMHGAAMTTELIQVTELEGLGGTGRVVEPPAHNYDTAYRNWRGEVLWERPVKDWDDATVDGWNAATMEHPLGSCDHACALRGSQCSDATMAAMMSEVDSAEKLHAVLSEVVQDPSFEGTWPGAAEGQPVEEGAWPQLCMRQQRRKGPAGAPRAQRRLRNLRNWRQKECEATPSSPCMAKARLPTTTGERLHQDGAVHANRGRQSSGYATLVPHVQLRDPIFRRRRPFRRCHLVRLCRVQRRGPPPLPGPDVPARRAVGRSLVPRAVGLERVGGAVECTACGEQSSGVLLQRAKRRAANVPLIL